MGEEWRLLIEFDADGVLAPAAEEIVAELDVRAPDTDVFISE